MELKGGQHSGYEEAINSRCASNAETAIKTRYQEWGRKMNEKDIYLLSWKKVSCQKIKSSTKIILLVIFNKKL